MCKRAKHGFSCVLLSALALMGVAPAQAADDYPNRPVKIIVPYPAGGTADLMARNFCEFLGRELGQSIVVENKPGAAGQLGTSLAAQAAPDGYTLGQSNAGTFEVSPHLYKSLPYNLKKDFEQIAVMGRMGVVFGVSAESPYKTLDDLIKDAKKHPGKLSFATPGVGSSNHLSGTLLASTAGFEWMHVPFKGMAEFLPAVLGGQVTALVDQYPSMMKQLEAGKIRGIAVSTAERIPSSPNVPTFKESGFPNLVFYSWFGLMVPKGVPAPVVDKLTNASRKVIGNPDYRAKVAALGAEPTDIMRGDMVKMIDNGSQVWKKVIEDNKITVDK
ncbi:tripartite tricarboxylate transporter substrate binding protein [Diaphorobacter sp.]|uniref:Bug family tripartite tricarboxylate transporter substrate binding protein n=1 Tax=Diaphorobacter sp. TaxID=1934310 RepID=UPI0028A9D58E|nr:tripartite tricarboxylate transporter substrate binding protein [Diaphorobacter sp.]